MNQTTDRRVVAARRIVSHIAEHLKADLSLRLWTGEVLPLGPGARDDIQIVVARPGAVRRLILKPGLMTLFELFASGDLKVEGGSPLEAADRWDHGRAVHLKRSLDRWLVAREALPFLLGRGEAEGDALPAWDATGDDGVGRDRSGRRDQDFIQFHYDVGNDFYGLFLDPEMVYSSAYFTAHDATLEAAQQEKLDRICRKLRLKPGQRMLDVGCGWGGLACWAAGNYGVHVHGVTLSQAQLDFARAKVERLGLSDRVTLELKDYREVEGAEAYDAIAQVEMFEHAGFANHERHFLQMRRLLKPGGLYFHQASVRRGGKGELRPTPTTKVITRFIFPGGELDTIGMTVTNLGRLGFETLDVEDMREHFELTLREWTRRLYERRDEAYRSAGEARTRLWLIYFALFAKGFERGAVQVYQTVAQKRRAGASGLPLDRASLYQ
ncbi:MULTISPECIES: cyclopropane-fatty-acyl-phospholipid synthase family protein [unclassified Brevundimonas]|uniref:SAM-dependent methyltransferase n=1 Tax=unclassified Brevundimonas TaxID=2622653 RepID=UPI000CFC5900|nr:MULTISPECIES: cyclopropane-fatty-acyl-phospholipid synthase family protein [unclassified Brevundimonas]PRA31684.1 cyclopropane-fatty-acyl-phospholipid synthase [Brevundimonas sp. MYb27]PQZ83557.1 cyclopropane-fatty-acyl-phospholipid synthase [Brevundimonas sp. MYb31]PRB15854.1 cyclopropane-fatty-acyl-phospholipid synthase [Brevundimonas sp. MYb52]PRB36350.1 cyclopropane-fatty-acyl-phospholipid synthase [Brevundimonas sp. MYb46]PRB45543.1 cyclopropane-fatty-acyl-phospholipid synthase [Brevun